MNRWFVYEALKGNVPEDKAMVVIEKMKPEEVKEGIIEYLMRKEKEREKVQ